MGFERGEREHGGMAAVAVALVLISLFSSGAVAAAMRLNTGLPPPSAAIDRSTPRTSVVGYLSACRSGDTPRAAHYLNLASVPEGQQPEIGPRLARRLKIVLDRRFWVNVDQLSDEPRGDLDDDLPPDLERLTTLETSEATIDILLQRVELDGGEYAWVFSGATVDRIDILYDAFGYGWLGDHLPEVFFTFRLAGIQLWQLCALALVTLIGWAVSGALTPPIMGALNRAARRTNVGWDDDLAAAVRGPFRWGLMAAALFVGASWVDLAEPVTAGVRVFWKLATILLLGWLLSTWVGTGARLLERSVGRDPESVARTFIPIFARVVKIGVWALVVVVGLDAVGVRVMGLVAGLGIGGLAIAFAAQKTIENFFGALSIAADRPFAVGDFVKAGDTLGTVEEVGLRSTRIRTPARTRMTIPNGTLLSERVENFSERDRMLYNPTISLLYDSSAAQIELVIDEIKKLLLKHPMIFHDTVRVRMAEFGESAINVKVFTWISTTDYHESTAVAEELNLAIMRIVERAGTGFAFPSRTIYTSAESGIDEQRARQAETIVAERRQRGDLWLPEPP